jgi:hypothetical protein
MDIRPSLPPISEDGNFHLAQKKEIIKWLEPCIYTYNICITQYILILAFNSGDLNFDLFFKFYIHNAVLILELANMARFGLQATARIGPST